MSRLWTVALFTLLLLIPTAYSNPIMVESTKELADTTPPGVHRIYGELVADEIYEQVLDSDYRGIVQKVTENGSRYASGSYVTQIEGANRDLRLYLEQQFDELSNGRLEIEIIGSYMNIVAKLPGYLPGNNPAFAVSAHYDSPAYCPGANTDGSGIATILTLIEIMSQYEWPLDLYFMVFNGLHPAAPMLFMEGSAEVVRELGYRDFETIALFNVDTILYPDPDAPSDGQIQMGYDILRSYTEGQYWAELTRAMSNNYGRNSIIPVSSDAFPFWPLSDHYRFSHRGYSGVVCAFESGSAVDGSYHSASDTWNNPTFRYDLGKEVTAAIGASIAYTMSRTYGEPTRIEFSLVIRSERTERLYIPISTPTQIDVSCRWFGGPASFQLIDPNLQIIGTEIFDSASAWEYTDVFNISVSEQGLYALTLVNTGHRSIGFELNYTYNSDIDDNNILDSQEFWIDPAYFSLDQDSDGLSAAEELFIGTDDNNVDSDGDMMDDKFEVDNEFDPTDPSDGSADEDGDGLTNAQEYSAGLNIFSSDSDSDLMPDKWELENGLNPLLDDSMLDLDGDGKTNLQEYLEETDPRQVEQEPLSIIWFMVPGILIAVIGGFLYYRRARFEY